MNPEIFKEHHLDYANILRKSIKTSMLFEADLGKNRTTRLYYKDIEGQTIFVVDEELIGMLKGAACGAYNELVQAGYKELADGIVKKITVDVQSYIEKRK